MPFLEECILFNYPKKCELLSYYPNYYQLSEAFSNQPRSQLPWTIGVLLYVINFNEVNIEPYGMDDAYYIFSFYYYTKQDKHFALKKFRQCKTL